MLHVKAALSCSPSPPLPVSPSFSSHSVVVWLSSWRISYVLSRDNKVLTYFLSRRSSAATRHLPLLAVYPSMHFIPFRCSVAVFLAYSCLFFHMTTSHLFPVKTAPKSNASSPLPFLPSTLHLSLGSVAVFLTCACLFFHVTTSHLFIPCQYGSQKQRVISSYLSLHSFPSRCFLAVFLVSMSIP